MHDEAISVIICDRNHSKVFGQCREEKSSNTAFPTMSLFSLESTNAISRTAMAASPLPVLS